MTDYTLAANDIEVRPEQLEEVTRRRVLAFLADYLAIFALSFLAGIVVFFFGILTLGLGWLLYGIIVPVVATLYFVLTLSGEQQTTLGMRLFALKMIRYDGAPVDFWTSILHLFLFWAGNMILPGFILLVAFFTRDKRLLHDMLLGTVVIRTDR